MQHKFYKQNISKEWLINNGFKYNKNLSDEETHIYTYRFPVFKYERMIVLDCELTASLYDDEIKINVYDYGTNDKYAPFYYCEYGNFDKMLKEIHNKINKELSKLNINLIEQKGNDNGSKNKEIKRKRNCPYKRK